MTAVGSGGPSARGRLLLRNVPLLPWLSSATQRGGSEHRPARRSDSPPAAHCRHLGRGSTASRSARGLYAVAISCSQSGARARCDFRTLDFPKRSETAFWGHGGHHVLLDDGHTVPHDVLLHTDAPQRAGPARGYVAAELSPAAPRWPRASRGLGHTRSLTGVPAGASAGPSCSWQQDGQ